MDTESRELSRDEELAFKNFRVWSSWWSPVGLGIFVFLGALSIAVLAHAIADLSFAFHRW